MKPISITIPEDLLNQLNKTTKKLQLPKEKIILQAIYMHLHTIEREEYIHSFKNASHDNNTLKITEEGMTDFLKMIDLS